MNKRFPPSLNPRIYTISSAIIGYALIDNFTANEQNAIGNWFMLIGQLLETNSSFQQMVEERIQGNTININSCQYKEGGSAYMNNPPLEPNPNDESDEIERLEKIIKIMQKEIDKIKR